MSELDELRNWARAKRYEALIDWAAKMNPIPKVSIPDTRQEMFDQILAELIETIESGWGITTQKIDQLWEMRIRFLELEEGNDSELSKD